MFFSRIVALMTVQDVPRPSFQPDDYYSASNFTALAAKQLITYFKTNKKSDILQNFNTDERVFQWYEGGILIGACDVSFRSSVNRLQITKRD